ncbi:MAG: class I SAM-dependent methyltransferase [Candidatus Niyogibacteria bacterium]|nr:class I SAM-dependent methyltransferase [Candidatus Niyogibacteria bacterium]
MFVSPQNVINNLELRSGMIAADFGCGAGYYTVPLAHTVGGNGKVYAYDVRKEMLEMVRSRARLEHLLNIEAVWADLEMPGATKLREETIDAVIISNILFQIDNKKAVLNEAVRILKKGGLLMVVEWDETAKMGGPAAQQKITREEAKRLAEENDCGFAKEFNAGDQHYGLLFKKNVPAQ